jgi:hypothetical protein
MFSEKRITNKNIEPKSCKSIKNISFRPVKEVFIISKPREQDENFKECCNVM